MKKSLLLSCIVISMAIVSMHNASVKGCSSDQPATNTIFDKAEKTAAFSYCSGTDIGFSTSDPYFGPGAGSGGTSSSGCLGNVAKYVGAAIGVMAVGAAAIAAGDAFSGALNCDGGFSSFCGSNTATSNKSTGTNKWNAKEREVEKIYTNLENELLSIGKTRSDFDSLLKEMTGVECLEDFNYLADKVICIGRDFPKNSYISSDCHYHNYAENNGYQSFFNVEWDHLIEEYGEELMKIVNIGVVEVGILFDYDFILLTNPYYYMNIENCSYRIYNPLVKSNYIDFDGKTIVGGFYYYTELLLIRNSNYYFVNPSNISWNSIPYPGSRDDFMSYYQPVAFRVSK